MSKQSRRPNRNTRPNRNNSDREDNIVFIVASFVIVLIIVFVAVLVVHNSHKKKSNDTATNNSGAALLCAADSSTTTSSTVAASNSQDSIAVLEGISPATFSAVGKGSVDASPKSVSGPALCSNGKLNVLYIGAEFCPYCGAERWSMIAALSRFGKFENVKITASSSTDVFPNTPTFTFNGATYSSQYIQFDGVEAQDRNRAALEVPTAAQQALWDKYNPNSYPFLDIGNRFVVKAPAFDPSLLAGMSQSEVMAALSNTSSKLSKAILGGANGITSAICKLTNNQPADVCTADIQALASDF